MMVSALYSPCSKLAHAWLHSHSGLHRRTLLNRRRVATSSQCQEVCFARIPKVSPFFSRLFCFHVDRLETLENAKGSRNKNGKGTGKGRRGG